MTTPNVPPSIEVLRTSAIANIYTQLDAMSFTTADDAFDAALTIAKLSEADHPHVDEPILVEIAHPTE